MRTQFYLVLFVWLLALFSGCNHPDDKITGPIPDPAYEYLGYDRIGTPISVGWLTIDFTDSLHISGKWEIAKITHSPDINYLAGKGELVGSIRQNQLWLNLQPNFKDNNLMLGGRLQNDTFAGSWYRVTFAGVSDSGTFRAVKN